MNLSHLKLFLRVAAIQNITAAGKEFGLSPAVASAYIQKLEDHLGVRLIHRTTRKVSLTEDGLAFLPHAENVLSSVDMAKASIGAGNVNPQGTLRITASASFGRMHLVPAMAEFLQRHPNIQADLHLSDSIVDMVEGGYDLAIRDAKLADSSFVARKIAPVRRVLCAAPRYIAEHGQPNHPNDIHNHWAVSLTGIEHWHIQDGKDVVTVKPPCRLRVDNGEAARDASARGAGIVNSSTWCCYKELQSGALVEIMPDYPLAAETALWALYPSAHMLAPKTRVFIDFLVERFGTNPDWV